MDLSAISSILRELNLNENWVANIYNHGSWVYGTNTSKSDRDIIIVTRQPHQNPLTFFTDFDYFHEFELHKLWNKYDVCVYSVENFEMLLEKSFLIAVQCVFLPDEFKLKEEIDFRTIYLDKYYNQFRLKQTALYENYTALNFYNPNNRSSYPLRSSESNNTRQKRKDYLFKTLFHSLRYLDFVEQLIQTRSIHDYKRVSYLFNEMKEIRGDSANDSNIERVLEFVRIKSSEFKAKLDALVPKNTITGAFEAQITFDCTDNSERVIEKLQKTKKYKIKFIQLDTYEEDKKFQQLMAISHYYGEYPSIVQQIEEEAYKHFPDIKIIRIKIKVLALHEGVPKTNIEKKLFWDQKTNYFELNYKVSLKNDRKRELEQLQDLCQTSYEFRLHLSSKVLKRPDEKTIDYIITMRLFDIGLEEATKKHEETIKYLTRAGYPPLKNAREFIVYDTNIELDDDWR